MKHEKMESLVELHVCNYSRDNAESCSDKGAKELTDNLKKWVKENHKGEMKVFRSGCLGKCENGIAMACYPEKKYILNARAEDAEEIKKGLKEALQKIKG
ncbi:MAG TPA: (2Fe-2S) ferredoxin domain-containing protein [Bacteriovoracaceae bacterium]|nr:(2Fe-2S) ferredoxin domain-containing protein [Bacteriovoracaceae bacterium]